MQDPFKRSSKKENFLHKVLKAINRSGYNLAEPSIQGHEPTPL